jgi:hypothetical protein
MKFREFITKQRGAIFIVGVAVFLISLLLSRDVGFDSLWGELFIDLAASSVTIIFTALIIDYLNMREQRSKTQNATNLAEDEIRAICFRIEWRIARLFGMNRNATNWDKISNRQEARNYLEAMTEEVDTYLSEIDFSSDKTHINARAFENYLERLQSSQNDLEQTLLLYEYALPYSLRERVLALRSELHIADRLLGFIDASESPNKANLSLIRITAQSVYDAVTEVLAHDSHVDIGKQLYARDSLIE